MLREVPQNFLDVCSSFSSWTSNNFHNAFNSLATMVQLEEVPDDELNAAQPGPAKDDEDDWDTDTGIIPYPYMHPARFADILIESDISEVDDEAPDETFFDRVAALKDIIPPTYRKRLSNVSSTGYSWASSALSLSGKTLWVVSTSALLLGVPWALGWL